MKDAIIVCIVVFVLAACVYGLTVTVNVSKANIDVCKRGGYVGHDWIDSKMVCYGYVDGNKPIVADFEDVKAGLGE